MSEKFPVGMESKTETMIAETFTEICFSNNRIADDEARINAKLEFYLNLRKLLKEIKENGKQRANNYESGNRTANPS